MIPYCKPELSLTQQDEEIICGIVESGQFCLGEYTKQLSEYFKDTYKVEYAIPCCNATNGLIIALRATNIVDRYIALPAFTWPSTSYAADLNKNPTLFIDVKPDTWTIDSNKIPPLAQAVLAVDTFGVNSLVETKRPVVYDAAHGFGIENLGHRGLAEVVSFSFTKRVTSMQGGIILTNKKYIYDIADELVRLSAKITEIQAYLFFRSLQFYNERLNDSKYAVLKYEEHLNIPYTVQVVGDNWNHSVYSILLKNKTIRDNCVRLLNKNGFETKVYYKPIISGLEVTDNIYSRILCLPVSKHIHDYIFQICSIINKAYTL